MPFTHEDTMHLHPAHDNAESRAAMPVLRRLELWWKATLFTEIAEVAKNWLIDRDSNRPGWHAAIQGRWPAPGLPQLTRQLSRRFQLAWASDRLVEARGHYHAAFNDPRNQGADMTAAKAQRAVAFLEAAAAALRAEPQREQPAQPRASRAAQGPRPSPETSSRARQAGREAAAEAGRRQREASERAAAAERAAEEARREDARRRREEAQQREETRRRREREAAEEARAREAQAAAQAARPDYPPPTPQRSELNGLEQLDHISPKSPCIMQNQILTRKNHNTQLTFKFGRSVLSTLHCFVPRLSQQNRPPTPLSTGPRHRSPACRHSAAYLSKSRRPRGTAKSAGSSHSAPGRRSWMGSHGCA